MSYGLNAINETIDASKEAKLAAQKLTRKRARMQILVVIVCAGVIVVGSRYSKMHRIKPGTVLEENTIKGHWSLQSVNKDPVGENEQSVVVDQQVDFHGGEVHGQTRLRADTPAGTTSMPLPDETASEVKTSDDGRLLFVKWDGTYTIKNGNIIELHIGKASYNAVVSLNPRNHTLELDHDAILTFPGKAVYHTVGTVSMAPK